MIGESDAWRKIRIVGMNKNAPIRAPTRCRRDDGASVIGAEVRYRVVAIQPERRIEFITQAIIHCQVWGNAPCVLRVYRISRKVVIHLKRSFANDLAYVTQQEIRNCKAGRVAVNAGGKNDTLWSFEVKKIESVPMIFVTELQAMLP